MTAQIGEHGRLSDPTCLCSTAGRCSSALLGPLHVSWQRRPQQWRQDKCHTRHHLRHPGGWPKRTGQSSVGVASLTGGPANKDNEHPYSLNLDPKHAKFVFALPPPVISSCYPSVTAALAMLPMLSLSLAGSPKRSSDGRKRMLHTLETERYERHFAREERKTIEMLQACLNR
jgi:hypothetical protein